MSEKKIWVLGNEKTKAEKSISWSSFFPNFADADVIIIDLTTFTADILKQINKKKLNYAKNQLYDKYLNRGTIIFITSPSFEIDDNGTKYSNYHLSPIHIQTREVPKGTVIHDNGDEDNFYFPYLQKVGTFDFYIEKINDVENVTKLTTESKEFHDKLSIDTFYNVWDNTEHILGTRFLSPLKLGDGDVVFLPPTHKISVTKGINKIIDIYQKPTSDKYYTITAEHSKQRSSTYDVLKNLENNLRELISAELSEISPKWWKQRIPEDIREEARKRKERNEKHIGASNHHLIFYVDFPDYKKIITRNDNWNDVFQNVFGNKQLLSSKLEELEPIRNAISHPRDLTSLEERRLKLSSEEIIITIKNYKKKKKLKKKKIKIKSWLKFKPIQVVMTTAFDRRVYPLDSVFHIRVNCPAILLDELIHIEIYNSQKELLAKSEIDPNTFEDKELKNTGLFETTIIMTGNKWKIGQEYYVIAKYGQAQVYDSCLIAERVPVIQTDKSVYMWSSDMIVTIIDPDADKDSYVPEYVGNSPDSQLIISSSQGKIENYKLRETGDSTGIFQGLIGFIGVFGDGTKHGYNLDGKILTQTQGTVVDDGFLEVKRSDKIIISYKNRFKKVQLTAFTSNFGAVIELDQKVYSNHDKVYITVVAPDYNFNHHENDTIGDTSKNEIIISTSVAELKGYKLNETGNDTGIFVGEVILIEFNQEKTNNAHGLGPKDGIIPAHKQDFITISFNYFGEQTIVASAIIK